MPDNTNVNTDPIWQAILQYCGSDGINVASAYFNKVTQDTNDVLSSMRQSYSDIMKESIDAAFSAATSMVLSGVCESIGSLTQAAGSTVLLRSTWTPEKEMNDAMKAANKASKELKEAKEKNDALLNMSQSKRPENYQDLLNTAQGTVTKKDQEFKELEKTSNIKQQKYKASSEKLQLKGSLFQGASQGLTAIPKTAEDANSQKQKSIEQVQNSLSNLINSSYDKNNQTLKAYLDVNYLQALIALGTIQLR